jgi:hypothetical protein
MNAAVSHLPSWRALGLGADDLTSHIARDRLAAIALTDPAHARMLTAELMECALALIADGYPTSAKLAAETLTICAGSPSGYAAGWMS